MNGDKGPVYGEGDRQGAWCVLGDIPSAKSED